MRQCLVFLDMPVLQQPEAYVGEAKDILDEKGGVKNDKTRAFSERFFKRTGRMPNMIQAGTYSATLQYLKAVKAAGTKDSDAVVKKLKELPVDDVFAQGGKVLENGRMVHDLYLFEVKKPSESKRPWDYYKQLAVVPGDKAFFTAKESGCPLTK